MASALNKRQQARNERTLQELIKTVSGNSACADCSSRNPGWASWSLGIFLCMRCAALHRKLGTHISKVKSLSMDKWDNAQVDNMKRIGNVESNKTYNPRNVKPQMPIDIDEVDGAMERYIRQKYEQRIYMHDLRLGTQHHTGSTSSEDRPPPLPPKPTGRFGFGLRKAATAPRNLSPPVSPGLGGFGPDTSPPRVNKASRVFGSNIHTSGDGLDSKLATLRDMGFPDEKRNSNVLKGLNGHLDRTVEALIRLGEQNTGKSRGSTPTPPAKSGTNGLTFDRSNTAPAAPSSTNPFDALDNAPAVSQQQQSAAPIQTQNQQAVYAGSTTQPTSPSNSYNPFMQQAQQEAYEQHNPPQQQQLPQTMSYQQNPWGQQQQQGLEQSFQNIHLTHQQAQQPLFPNRTGGYGQAQPSPYAQTNPYQQPFTPPLMPQIPEQYGSFMPPQPQYQSMSSSSSPGNPFLRSSRSQVFTPMHQSSNPFGQAAFQQQTSQQMPQQQVTQQPQAPNPWSTQPQSQPSNAQSSNPWQGQQQSYQTQQQSFPNPQQNFHTPLQTQNQPQPSQTPQQTSQGPQQTFQSQQQSSNPFDKNSILALYNQPQLAPQRTEQQQTPAASALPPAPTGPVSGNMNPFGMRTGNQQGQPLSAAQTPGVRHVSNESVDFSGLMGGRHSPDAFSGLSSSFRR